MTRVVVGYDGSEGARAALDWARQEARLRAVPLVVVHAWAMPFSPAYAGLPVPELQVQEAAKQGARRVLDEALSLLDDQAAVEALLVEGGAAAGLIGVVNADDILVVGSRGRGGFASLLLGSTGQQLAQHAPCPVVIVTRR